MDSRGVLIVGRDGTTEMVPFPVEEPRPRRVYMITAASLALAAMAAAPMPEVPVRTRRVIASPDQSRRVPGSRRNEPCACGCGLKRKRCPNGLKNL